MSLKVWAYRRLKNTIRSIKHYLPRLRREYIYNYPLSKSIDLTFNIEGAELTKISPQQVTDLLQIWNVDKTVMATRLDRGDNCYVVYKNSRAHWVQNSGVHFVQPAGQYIQIAERELWIYHVRVAEEFRGKGVAGMVYAEVLKEFQALGYKKAWIYTSSVNKSNQRSLGKLGFEFHSYTVSLKIGKKFLALKKLSI